MNLKNRVLTAFILIFACIGLDRAMKIIAKEMLHPYEVTSLLYDTIRLQYAENTGAFLSLGADIPEPLRHLLFTVAVGIFLTAMLFYLLASKQWTRLQLVAMSLVLGGGYGNLIDRLLQEGRVFDFLNVGIGPVRTGIFNIADMSITFGVLWFLFLSIRKNNPVTPETAE